MTLKDIETGSESSPVQKPHAMCTLLNEETGQDLIEYALIFTFLALTGIASLRLLTTGILNVFAAVGTALTSAT